MDQPPLVLKASDLEALPVFPLPGSVLFPGAFLPLHVFEPRYREMTRDVLAGRRFMAVARLKPGFEADYDGRPPLFDVCGVGAVIHDEQRPDGRYDVLLRGVARVRITRELPPFKSYRCVRAERLPDEASDAAPILALQRQLDQLWEELWPHLPYSKEDLRHLTQDAPGPSAFADRVADILMADPDQRQRVLEERDPAERLCLVIQQAHSLVSAFVVRDGSELN